MCVSGKRIDQRNLKIFELFRKNGIIYGESTTRRVYTKRILREVWNTETVSITVCRK